MSKTKRDLELVQILLDEIDSELQSGHLSDLERRILISQREFYTEQFWDLSNRVSKI